MTASAAGLDLEEQVARIQRMNAETGEFIAEGQKFTRERALAPLAIAKLFGS